MSISGLICSLYVVICVFFEDFGYGKTSKSRRIASTNAGSISILPPSVLAIRGDLLVFPYPKSTKNTQITTYSQQIRRKLVWLKGQTARDIC